MIYIYRITNYYVDLEYRYRYTYVDLIVTKSNNNAMRRINS